ncbi:MAG TPA: mechanosensitive ion channel family protein [Syntrophobacteria bacterium]|nr:mechanosensitive ion channel family protein [Syntrophobacteria bacterium]
MEQGVKSAEKLATSVIDFFVNYSFQVLGAILVLIAGFIVARLVFSFLLGLLEKRKIDITLSKFVANVAKLSIIVFAVIVALSKFGITITPLVAAITAGAFGASFAIQGPLSNYGAGLVIIVSRPFVVGDTITVVGVSGVVEEITLGATTLTSVDGVKITIPNKHIVGEILHNSKDLHLVEGTVGISYSSNLEEAIGIIRSVLAGFEEVPKSPAPLVGVKTFGDSSITIDYRYWVPTKKYFSLRNEVNLALFTRLAQARIEIPFPQRQVHIMSSPAHPARAFRE